MNIGLVDSLRVGIRYVQLLAGILYCVTMLMDEDYEVVALFVREAAVLLDHLPLNLSSLLLGQ